eukprot:scaffold9940_cov161-Amphora_coffeaeformis.AAC.2
MLNNKICCLASDKPLFSRTNDYTLLLHRESLHSPHGQKVTRISGSLNTRAGLPFKNRKRICQTFPQDALERARFFHIVVGKSGTGSYTCSNGLVGVRELVADLIDERDGHDSNPSDIF